MTFPPDIQKIEREKRKKKREEMDEVASPLRIKRKMTYLSRGKVDQLRERVRSCQRSRWKCQKTYLSQGKVDQKKERVRPH